MPQQLTTNNGDFLSLLANHITSNHSLRYLREMIEMAVAVLVLGRKTEHNVVKNLEKIIEIC
jgi:hypothetical protein